MPPRRNEGIFQANGEDIDTLLLVDFFRMSDWTKFLAVPIQKSVNILNKSFFSGVPENTGARICNPHV
jgi:hypothetical protein